MFLVLTHIHSLPYVTRRHNNVDFPPPSERDVIYSDCNPGIEFSIPGSGVVLVCIMIINPSSSTGSQCETVLV